MNKSSGCSYCDESGKKRCQDGLGAHLSFRSGPLWDFKINSEKGLIEAVDVNGEIIAYAYIDLCPKCGRRLS